jgi:hypothetical protein
MRTRCKNVEPLPLVTALCGIDLVSARNEPRLKGAVHRRYFPPAEEA